MWLWNVDNDTAKGIILQNMGAETTKKDMWPEKGQSGWRI
jgi:hypothetical protein